MAEKKRVSGLGRGLSALLEEAATPPDANGPGVARLSVADIGANPHQPRRHFDAGAMDDLIASVKAHGVLQPILVRPVAGGRYEIIAGERRWRAAQAAALHEIPAVVRPLDDRTAFEIALIENIQRSDLNAIEEAEAYARLAREFSLKQEDIAQRVGKNRATVANAIRLLDLAPDVKDLLAGGQLSVGHAKVLLGLKDVALQNAAANQIVRRGLTVRATEQLVGEASKQGRLPTDANTAGARKPPAGKP